VALQSSVLGSTPKLSLGRCPFVLVGLAGRRRHELEENSTAHSVVLAQQWHESVLADSYHHGLVALRNHFADDPCLSPEFELQPWCARLPVAIYQL